MKQVQNLYGMKMNLARIISDCRVAKFNPNNSQHQSPNRSRIKMQPIQDSDINKSLDFESCVKNIRNRIRSLQSEKDPNSPLLSKIPSHRTSVCEDEFNQSPKKISPARSQYHANDTRGTSQLPRLMAKYQKAHSPKNASSSEKYTFMDRNQKNKQKGDASEDFQSYHTLLGERKKKEEMQRIFTISKIIKQNVIREKKMLVNRKKQRRLENLNLKQIVINKTCL